MELRDALRAELDEAGKLAWAEEEFAAILSAPPKEPRPDPWRRTSGIHRLRTRRSLAVVRELWMARDQIARDRDLSPGRVLADTAIVEAALQLPRTPDDLGALPAFRGRNPRRHAAAWFRAVQRGRMLPDASLPEHSLPGEGPPPAHRWAERDPAAAERLSATRAVVAALADEHTMPTENLLPARRRTPAGLEPAGAGHRGVGGDRADRARLARLAGRAHGQPAGQGAGQAGGQE